jgi:hypothetical protein
MKRVSGLTLFAAALMIPAAAQAQPFFEESFDTNLGPFNALNDGATSSAWAFDSTCPATGVAGHTVAGTAHWFNPATCFDYGSAATNDALNSPRVEVPDCALGVRVAFNYLLELDEGASCDRARVEAIVDGGTPVIYGDNGVEGFCARPEGTNAGLGNLIVDATWRHHEFIVPDATPGSLLEVRFEAETFDGLFNDGTGFLVDDVTMACVVPFYEIPALGTVGFGAFGALLVAAALVALARRRRAA